MNKQQTVERFTADLKTVSLFNITEHSVFGSIGFRLHTYMHGK